MSDGPTFSDSQSDVQPWPLPLRIRQAFILSFHDGGSGSTAPKFQTLIKPANLNL